MLPVVFVDADVLYSPTLRAWLFNLVSNPPQLFELVVTEDVIAEAVARYRDRNPRCPGAITAKMAQHIRELCTVLTDFDCDIDFPGADEGDIHVHAAVVESGAGYLLTRDQGFHGLEERVKDSLSYEIYEPDDFFLLADEQFPAAVREAARAHMRHHASLHGKKASARGGLMVEKLENAGCPKFAAIVSEHLKTLAGR